MIKVKTLNDEVILSPTIFPDGTSQIWKLPPSILNCREYSITWNFESEREIIDLYSFKALLAQPEQLRYVTLNIPYLPYARQDKRVDNSLTFNLEVFATLINGLGFNEVTSVDVHNPKRTSELIEGFKNIDVVGIHEKVIMNFRPTKIVFPDSGAMTRYGKELSHVSSLFLEKIRNQATGEITGLNLYHVADGQHIGMDERLLIVDDICDGGATFIKAAERIRQEKYYEKATIGLFITHGIFSRGRKHLIDNGIDVVYTTNSLLKNEDGYGV